MAESMLCLHKSALEYLDQTGGIASIRQRCAAYRESHTKAFQFDIPIEPRDLVDLDAGVLGMFARLKAVKGQKEIASYDCTYLGRARNKPSDKLTLEVIDAGTFSDDRRRHQALTAHLRDELTQNVEIGGRYRLIGQLVQDSDRTNIALEVNSITSDKAKESIPTTADTFSSVPESIQQILEDRKESAWSFGMSLAYAFGDCITPCGTYLHLKLGMLLSLVGNLTSKGSRGLDLLAIGTDTIILDRLLRYGAQFADRCVVHSSLNHLNAATTKRLQGEASCMIEGGSLMLAKGGICLLPELSTYKKTVRHALHQTLDRGSVLVPMPTQVSGAGRSQIVLPLSCKVWGYLDPQANKKAQHFEDLSQQVDMGTVSKELASVFGMVYFADLSADSYADYTSVHQTMLTAMGAKPVPLISDEDFRTFLSLAREQSPSFTPSAERLIKGYYVASRHVRASSINTAIIPQSAVKTITSLASAHAQLNLHQCVTEEDAVLAILLYEESIVYKHGDSLLNVKPLPHIKDNNIQMYIGQERDKLLRMFHYQLRNFVELHAPEDPFPEE